MPKFVLDSGGAYETAPGVTDEEAAELGLIVVELSYTTNPPTPTYGRYVDPEAPKAKAKG